MHRPLVLALMTFNASAWAAPVCVETSADGRHYAICEEQGVDRTWFDANGACFGQYRTTLATIETPLQQATLLVTRQDAFGIVEPWIGLQDLSSEGDFRWAEGGQLDGSTFWRPGEPNNVGNEDCVVMGGPVGGPDGFWNDVPCDVGREAFVCNLPVPLTDRVDDMVSDANALYTTTFGGEPPLDEGADARLRPSVIEGQLQEALDALDNGGCSVDFVRHQHAAGIFGRAFAAGEDSFGDPLVDPGYQLQPDRVFGWTQGTIQVGRAGGYASTFDQGKLLAERDESNGFVAGRYVRVSGRRGVFLTLLGTCREAVDPFQILESGWF